MTDANTICHDVDLLGDWLDAKGYTEEAGLCLRVLGLIHEQAEENEKLKADADKWNNAYLKSIKIGIDQACDSGSRIGQLSKWNEEFQAEIESLRAEIEKLRAALKPFANLASIEDNGTASETEMWFVFGAKTVSIADLRAAAAALKDIDTVSK